MLCTMLEALKMLLSTVLLATRSRSDLLLEIAASGSSWAIDGPRVIDGKHRTPLAHGRADPSLGWAMPEDCCSGAEDNVGA